MTKETTGRNNSCKKSRDIINSENTASDHSGVSLTSLEMDGKCTQQTAEIQLVPEDVLKKAIELLLAKDADFGDVFVERASYNSVKSDDRKINTSTRSEKGVGIRAVKNGKTFYAYTDSFTPAAHFTSDPL